MTHTGVLEVHRYAAGQLPGVFVFLIGHKFEPPLFFFGMPVSGAIFSGHKSVPWGVYGVCIIYGCMQEWYVWIYVYTYVCMYVCMYTHTHTHTHARAHTHTHTNTHLQYLVLYHRHLEINL